MPENFKKLDACRANQMFGKNTKMIAYRKYSIISAGISLQRLRFMNYSFRSSTNQLHFNPSVSTIEFYFLQCLKYEQTFHNQTLQFYLR
jgi:hypothetical protein